MINVYDYVDTENKIKVTFVDGTSVVGFIESVDDEEESELGEPGITLNAEDGPYMGIAQSEIQSITVLEEGS